MQGAEPCLHHAVVVFVFSVQLEKKKKSVPVATYFLNFTWVMRFGGLWTRRLALACSFSSWARDLLCSAVTRTAF